MAYIEVREGSGLNNNPCTINGDSAKAAMTSPRIYTGDTGTRMTFPLRTGLNGHSSPSIAPGSNITPLSTEERIMTEIFYSEFPSHNVYVPPPSIAYNDKPCKTSGRLCHDVVNRGSLSRMRSRLNGQITTRTETRKLQSLRCPYKKEERDIVKKQNVCVPPSRRHIRKEEKLR